MDVPEADTLGTAAERIRDTSKWLIGAFAAVGAALLAGTQLAALGTLSGWRLALAFAAVPLGLMGVALSIGAAAAVTRMSEVTLTELATPVVPPTRRWFKDLNKEPTAKVQELLRDDPTMRGSYDDVEQLRGDFVAKQSALHQAGIDYYADTSDQTKKKALQLAQARMDTVDAEARRLLGIASFQRLAFGFGIAERYMLAGITLTAIALVAFAYASHPPKNEGKAKTSPPTPVVAETRVRLSDLGKRELSGRGGKPCTADFVQAVVLSSTESISDVVTTPTGGCRGIRIKVPTNLGSVVGG